MVNVAVKRTLLAVLIGVSVAVGASVQSDMEEAIKRGESALGDGFIDSLISNESETVNQALQSDSAYKTDNEITYKILISFSMGEDNLKRLFKSFEHRSDVVFVIRGMLPQDKTINDVGMRIINLIRDFKNVPTVQLDPRPFQDIDAKFAPVILAYQGDEIINFATGLTNPSYLYESMNKGKIGDLGNYGKTVKIAERDLVEILKERSAKIDTDELIKQAKNNYWPKAKFLSLPEALETRIRNFEPIITLKEDIVATEGVVIAKAGTQINTLSKIPFTMRLVIFDATNPAHVAFVRSLPESSLRTKYITTKFDKSLEWNAIKDVENKINAPVYQLNRDILTSFDLRVIPSVVTADNANKYFVISEYAIKGTYE